MFKKLLIIFLIIIMFFITLNTNKIFANEVEDSQDSNILVDNTISDVDILHNDLSAIISILVFFILVILLYFAYKFLNIFFTI